MAVLTFLQRATLIFVSLKLLNVESVQDICYIRKFIVSDSPIALVLANTSKNVTYIEALSFHFVHQFSLLLLH